MDRTEALALLRVSEADAADPARLRRAFRAAMRAAHPDLNPHAGSTDATIAVSAAYESLTEVAAPEPPAESRAAPPRAPDTLPRTVRTELVDDSTIRLAATREEALAVAIEAAHRLGEIGYLDSEAGLLEVVVEFVEAPTSSVVLTLQGRADGVDVFVAVEPLSGGESPPLAAVTALLGRTLAGVTRRGG